MHNFFSILLLYCSVAQFEQWFNLNYNFQNVTLALTVALAAQLFFGLAERVAAQDFQSSCACGATFIYVHNFFSILLLYCSLAQFEQWFNLNYNFQNVTLALTVALAAQLFFGLAERVAAQIFRAVARAAQLTDHLWQVRSYRLGNRANILHMVFLQPVPFLTECI